MTLKIKFFITVIITVIQCIECTTGFCSITYINHPLCKYNNITNNVHLYPKKQIFLYNNDPRKYRLNYIHNVNNTIMICPYSHQSPFSMLDHNMSKIHIQNNSIHMSYMFYNYQNNYQKILPFIQLGFQKNFPEKIVSIGGGNRYAYNHLYAVGYNVFYHFPVFIARNTIHAINIHQPPYINISGEYWYRNMLFILNSFYKINNFIDLEHNLQENKNYPHSGYQIHIQNQFFKFLECTGKITLEHFLYKKSKHEKYSMNNKSCNYRLICSVDYHPIPILGININKIFTNSKVYNDLTCQICIDYKFNIPIAQQIYCINDTKKYPSIFLYLNEIIQPFFPVAPYSINNSNNYKIANNMLKSDYIEEITGYPGEKKLIHINTEDTENNKMQHNRYVQWNMQSLQILYKYGGNITPSHEASNIYIMHMPTQLITRERQLIVSYVIVDHDNTKNFCNANIEKKIIILVKNFQQNKIKNNSTNSIVDLSNTTVAINNDNFKALDTNRVKKNHQTHDISSVESENADHYVNHEIPCSVLTELQYPIVYDNDSINKDINTQDSSRLNIINNDTLPYHLQSKKSVSSSDHNITKDDTTQTIVVSSSYHTTMLPIPPLSPLSLLNSETNTLQSLLEQTLPKNNNCNDFTIHPKDINNHQNMQTMTSSSSISALPQQTDNIIKSENIDTDNNINNSSHLTLKDNLLFMHKKDNFSSIGTAEHINKLENFTINKKSKNVSEMGKIFAKLRLTQSTSSIDDEPYYTTDDESN